MAVHEAGPYLPADTSCYESGMTSKTTDVRVPKLLRELQPTEAEQIVGGAGLLEYVF